MRTMMSFLLAMLMLVSIAACYDATKPLPPYQPIYGPPPADDQSGGASCAAACSRLLELGCPEGEGACAATCSRASELRSLPLACWAAAKTKADAKACGSLRCTR